MSHSANSLDLKVFSRGKGACAVAKAAYRHCKRMTNERTQEQADYSRKRGLLAEGVIGWDRSPEELWNAAEKAETRSNATVARELMISLPHELPLEEQVRLTKGMCLWLRDRYGVSASWVIHDERKQKTNDDRSSEQVNNDFHKEEDRPPVNHTFITPDTAGEKIKKNFQTDTKDNLTGNKNIHTHIMFTVRKVDKNGNFNTTDKKRSKLDEAINGDGGKELKEIREHWQKRVNSALEKAGVEKRVDMRSLEARAKEDGTPLVEAKPHLGPKKHYLKEKVEKKEREAKRTGKAPPAIPHFMSELRRIDHRNKVIKDLWSFAFDLEKSAREGTIKDSGDKAEEEAIKAALESFEGIYRAGSMIQRSADRHRRENARKKAQERQQKQMPKMIEAIMREHFSKEAEVKDVDQNRKARRSKAAKRRRAENADRLTTTNRKVAKQGAKKSTTQNAKQPNKEMEGTTTKKATPNTQNRTAARREIIGSTASRLAARKSVNTKTHTRNPKNEGQEK